MNLVHGAGSASHRCFAAFWGTFVVVIVNSPSTPVVLLCVSRPFVVKQPRRVILERGTCRTPAAP